jgi:transposase
MTEALDGRQQRGLAIAATARIERKGRTFSVPSQSMAKRYTVIHGRDGFACTCPDFELTGQTCKHGFAVQYLLKRETAPDGTVTETRAVRVTYSQNWPAYNAAQVSEKDTFCALLKDLVANVPEPEQQRGRPRLPIADRLFCATFKVYSTVSGRRFMTDMRAAANAGMVSRAPHYNLIFNVIEDASLTDTLKALVMQSALPLKALETDFAVDSTGFGINRFYRHVTAKYGKERVAHDWLKLHAIVGTKTNVITAAEVTDKDTNDGPLLRALVASTAQGFTVKEVSADKAYSIKRNLLMLEMMGATPFIPFKTNAVGHTTSSVWNRLFHFFHLHRETFLESYHKRSNVESAFSALKRKFGDSIRSKTATAQVNETLLKVIAYNLCCVIHEMHESGIAAMFPLVASKPIQQGDAEPPPAQ